MGLEERGKNYYTPQMKIVDRKLNERKIIFIST